MIDNFAVFILTHGRSDKVYTYTTLRNQGYTGKIYLLVDNEDKEIENYKKKYKDQVIVFNKQDAIDYTDSGDNFKKRNSVVYARNWNFIVAKELGIKYFWQLDDDYTTFRYTANHEKQYITSNTGMKNFDKLLSICIEFMKKSNFDCIAWAQGGDFIGGPGSGLFKKFQKGQIPRKIMNSFLCDSDKPFKFMGRINEDVNCYVELGKQGKLFGTIAQLRLEQKETQSNSGGLTEIYLDLGTYVKSFYSVMYSPSCVSIIEMGVKNRRLHHKIHWKNAIPMIIDEKFKKVNHAKQILQT